jgi:tetratricopeptide (TPR) repeat protein
MQAPAIAAVLIVRNEAARLATCLEALLPAVDEIVVVDTGPDAATKAVARRFTSHVFDVAWTDDFAAARNAALAHARAPWVLVVDADEVLQEPLNARAHLRAFAACHGAETIGTVAMHSPTGAEPDAPVVIDHLQRFFQRDAWRFEGRIHEQPVLIAGVKQAAPVGIRFWHTGYAQAHDDPDHKAHRNIPLLEASIAEAPGDEYLWYQLGKARYSLHDYAGAADALETALRHTRFKAGEPPRGSAGPVARAILTDTVVSLAYAYANLQRLADAQRLLETHAALAHPGTQRADFAHVRGYIALMQGHIAEARAAYEAALARGPDQEDVVGTGSFASHYHLGLLAEADQTLDHAVEHYINALRIEPAYRPALARLADFVAEHDLTPPRAIVALFEPVAWQSIYLGKLRDRLAAGDMTAVRRLTQGALAMDAGLLEACKSVLRDHVD